MQKVIPCMSQWTERSKYFLLHLCSHQDTCPQILIASEEVPSLMLINSMLRGVSCIPLLIDYLDPAPGCWGYRCCPRVAFTSHLGAECCLCTCYYLQPAITPFPPFPPSPYPINTPEIRQMSSLSLQWPLLSNVTITIILPWLLVIFIRMGKSFWHLESANKLSPEHVLCKWQRKIQKHSLIYTFQLPCHPKSLRELRHAILCYYGCHLY